MQICTSHYSKVPVRDAENQFSSPLYQKKLVEITDFPQGQHGFHKVPILKWLPSQYIPNSTSKSFLT